MADDAGVSREGAAAIVHKIATEYEIDGIFSALSSYGGGHENWHKITCHGQDFWDTVRALYDVDFLTLEQADFCRAWFAKYEAALNPHNVDFSLN